MGRKIFQARYDGRCYDGCGEKIDQGDDVVYNDDDKVVHEACYDGETYS